MVYIIIDGVPADQIERLTPPAIYDIASHGAYSRAYTGDEMGGYSQTATISANGREDNWIKLATVKAGSKGYEVDLRALPSSDSFRAYVRLSTSGSRVNT